MLEGFGFGAALLAMFMRVGGGIFTKAADVGADLVGKVEQGIPEDDPRNAATIADNVGDNVGDCAGMAADLFESYAVTLVAALILGSAAFGDEGPGLPADRPGDRRAHRDRSASTSPGRGRRERPDHDQPAFYISAAHLRGAVRRRGVHLPARAASRTSTERRHRPSPAQAWRTRRDGDPRLIATVAVVDRHRAGGRHPGADRLLHRHRARPVKDVGKTSLTGAATVILSGLSVGFESAVYTALVIGAAVFGAFLLGGGSLIVSLFAVALAGCGLLTTVGVIVAMDTFGPVSDNAQGIAEMSGDVDDGGRADPHRARRGRQHHQGHHQGHRDRDRRAGRDRAVRLATPTLGRSTSLARGPRTPATIEAYRACDFTACSTPRPVHLVGVLLGAAVVFLFSGLAINAVARAAGAVVFEVRRQFREIPGIMEGTGRPEYGKVVDIVHADSLRELATPGLLAIFAPIAVGFGLGVGPLGRLPRRRHRHRHPDGGLPGQLRWRVGQRQEAGRGRQPRRQGLRRPRGHDHRRHRR